MLAAGDCGRHGGAQWAKRDRDNRAHTKVPLTRAGEVHIAGELGKRDGDLHGQNDKSEKAPRQCIPAGARALGGYWGLT